MTTSDIPTDAPKRLTRSKDDRLVAGVCSGAARYYDIDPVIPRIVLAVLAVFGGAGIAVYFFAWVLIPEDGSPSTRLERWLEGRAGDRGRDLLIVLVVLFSLGFLVDTHPFAHRISGAALFVVAVMTVAALVGRRRTERAKAAGTPYGPAPMAYSSSVTYAPTAPFGPQPQPDSGYAPTTVFTPPMPLPPRERSWLPWLTLGATLLVAGMFGLAGSAGWADPQPVDVLAACLAVVGVGVLIGAFFGRAWSMIPLGLLLVGGLAVTNALPRHLTWSAGDRYWTPTVAGQPAAYVLGAGHAQLDLRSVPAGSSVTIDTRLGAGQLEVFVPRGTAVDLHATASAGRILVLNQEQDGTGVTVDRKLPGSGAAPTTITLNVEMGFGDVEVSRITHDTVLGGTR